MRRSSPACELHRKVFRAPETRGRWRAYADEQVRAKQAGRVQPGGHPAQTSPGLGIDWAKKGRRSARSLPSQLDQLVNRYHWINIGVVIHAFDFESEQAQELALIAGEVRQLVDVV